MKKNIFKVNFIRLRTIENTIENTYGFVSAFTKEEAKQIVAQGNASPIEITSVEMVS
jgi:hypothetical protein